MNTSEIQFHFPTLAVVLSGAFSPFRRLLAMACFRRRSGTDWTMGWHPVVSPISVLPLSEPFPFLSLLRGFRGAAACLSDPS